jgi:hypothetical protein
VIPRVSAALALFIAPIATSGKQNLPTKQDFERFVPQKKKDSSGHDSEPSPGHSKEEKPPESALAPVIPLRPKSAEALTLPSGTPTGNIPAGISQALLQLVAMLQGQRAVLQRWFGAGAYQAAARQQKKNGRIRKGTVLDEKAE